MMNDTASTHSAPPMRAFQGLILTKTRRIKRRSSSGTAAKTPIDPLDALGVDDDDDDDDTCQSELTEDDSRMIEADSSGMFDNLQRNWSSGDRGYLEQACFASFCSVFYDSDSSLPPPHRVVVTGLWAYVVLPSLLGDVQMPQLVAQDIWNVLRTKLQYITEDDHNAVTLSHVVYNDYGQRIAENADSDMWKHDFAAYLQRSLVGDLDQPHFVQLYASQVIVPYWLSLNQVKKAASLLHQPSFSIKQWKLLAKQDNPLQITIRHVKLMELYLDQLPPSSSKWQEALGLYQGWHTLLQQEMQIRLESPVNESADGSSLGSNGSSNRSKGSSSKRRRKKSSRRKKQVDPMQLMILGRSLFVLSVSLDSILTELPGTHSAMSVLWRRQAEYLSEAMQVFAQMEEVDPEMRGVQALLNAAAWLAMSTSCATLEECDVDEYVDIDKLATLSDLGQIVEGETDEMQCINIAKALLEQAVPSKRSKTLQLAYLTLKAELHDTWGRWLYDKQRYERARLPLEEATNLRRQVLALLKDTQSDSHTLFWWGSSPTSEGEDETESLCQKLCLHVPDSEHQVQETEIALARSLEYAALALHACDLSMAAMSWLQEALILKTSHLGKMSLEVARLNGAIAIVHEDLIQWEAGLSRYRECLRVRMHVLSQKDPDEWFKTEYELFHSILETLTSMGSAYRMLGDHDNSVGCYWKIATMSKKEWESLNASSNSAGFWGFEGHRKMASDLRPAPLPTTVLQEERYSKVSLEISPPQFSPSPPKNDNNKQENAILRQAAQAYQTILSLFEDKVSKQPQTTSYNLASSVPMEDVPLLLAASYRLGLIHVHFGDFRSAISALEHALHSLWVLDPSTSDSSSESEDDGNRRYSREAQRRQKVLRGIFGNEMETVDDDGVYHTLGICRAACGEHDQAVRFHLTALRSARRMYGVDSRRASEILYDAATSYWYLKDYDKAEEFWSSCLQIELMKEGAEKDCSDDENSDVTAANLVADLESVEDAKILYNIGASLCVLGRYSDNRTQDYLQRAKAIFSEKLGAKPQVKIANCLFYLATLELRRTGAFDVLRLKKAGALLNRASSIYRALGYLMPGSDSGFVKHKPLQLNVPLQAHIRFLEGSISEALGKLHLAMDTYNVALHMYRRLGDERWNIYVASVLNTTGKLHVKMYHEYVALPIFEEALKLRQKAFGNDHEAVGDTLYHMAEIHAKMENIPTALEMYHEALRIQVTSEGSDGPNVAMTLQMIASLYIKQGMHELGMEKLKASLLIRKNRIDLVDRASQVVSFWSGDLADDFLTLSKEEPNREDDGDHVRRTLQDDLIKEEVGLAVVLHCMGNVYVKLGEYKEAKACFEQSLRVRRTHSADDVMSPDGTIKLQVSDTLHNLGCLYELQEDYANALRYFATALKLKHNMVRGSKEASSRSHPKERSLLIYNGKGCLDGRYLSSKGSISYAMTLHRLGSIHYRLGNNNISLAYLGAALRIQKHYLGLHHPTIARTLVDMASVMRRTDNMNEAARDCYKEACQIRKMRNRSDANVGHILFHIGQLYEVDNDYSRATTYYYRSIQSYGHRYAHNLSRRVCEALLLRKKKSICEQQGVGDMLSKEGLSVRSIEETDDTIRSHFATVASAMRDVSRKRLMASADNGIMMNLDVDAPDCWISLELYLLSLFELVHYVSVEWTKEARLQLQDAFRQLEQAGLDGVKTDPEAITFQMLYLIQE